MTATVWLAEAYRGGERTECVVHATYEGAIEEVTHGEVFAEADRIEISEGEIYGGPLGPIEVVAVEDGP